MLWDQTSMACYTAYNHYEEIQNDKKKFPPYFFSSTPPAVN